MNIACIVDQKRKSVWRFAKEFDAAIQQSQAYLQSISNKAFFGMLLLHFDNAEPDSVMVDRIFKEKKES